MAYLGCLYMCTHLYNWSVYLISQCIYLTFLFQTLGSDDDEDEEENVPDFTCTLRNNKYHLHTMLQRTTSFTILVGMPFWVITSYESLSRSRRLPTGRRFNVQGPSSSSTFPPSKYVFRQYFGRENIKYSVQGLVYLFYLATDSWVLIKHFLTSPTARKCQRLLCKGKN